MARGGRRPGAGRKTGSVTQKTREIAEKAHASGVTPLEVMLEAMHAARDAGDLKTAASFARDAAPYIHAKLSSVQTELTGPDGGPVEARIETITRRIIRPT
jgi:hypothetical protein